MERNRSRLEINSCLYESGIEYVKACRKSGAESYLKAVERVSSWASSHHPGRFADGALENIALEVGRMLEEGGNATDINPPGVKPRRSRTLHVATKLADVGGHSRVLVKWVASDKSADHVILLTDQREAVPDFLQQIIAGSDNHCICLPHTTSIKNRAAAVRDIALSCDRVVLHTHSHDSIPVVAFAKDGGPPVAMFNHAHYSFNLGTTVSDIIINTLEYFRSMSERYRFARSTAILSITAGLWSMDCKSIDKEAARRALSLPDNSTVIMSMAVENYYRPMDGYNFFDTARSILRKLPDAYLMIVGVPKDSPLVPADLRSNSRMLLMGPVLNPILHCQASDIFLESFPMPSLGSVTEAVAYGEAYPVPVYGPGESILRVQRSPIITYPYRPEDEKKYIEYVVRLASNKNDTRAEAQKMRVGMEVFDRRFESDLQSLNQLIDKAEHRPCNIPVSNMIDSPDCRSLAELDRSDIGEKIDALFPFGRSLRQHADAVLSRYQTGGNAMKRIQKRITDKIKRSML